MKPKVIYTKSGRIEPNWRAVVLTEGHHTLKTKDQWRITSTVLRITEEGFETENTLYVKATA